MRSGIVERSTSSWMSRAILAVLSCGAFTGCAEPPIQTGNNQVPELNVALAASKDGKYATQAWPLVDGIMVGWLDGAFAPGCAVGVAIDDEIVYLKGYCPSRLGLDAEDWAVSTMRPVARVSETLTALAAMRQVQKGWLDLEEHAGDRLPLEGDLISMKSSLEPITNRRMNTPGGQTVTGREPTAK